MKKDHLVEKMAAYGTAARSVRRLESRKAMTLAGVAVTAGAALMGGGSVHGAIVYHDISPYATVAPTYNVYMGGGNKFFIYYTAYHANGISINNHAASAAGQMVEGATNVYAKRFIAGSSINNAANWTGVFQKLCGSDVTWGQKGAFRGVDGYIGVRFNTASGTNPKYGWIRFEGSANGHVGTVKSWGFQNDGAVTGIRAGEAQ